MEVVTAFRVSGWDTPFWVGPNRAARRWNKQGSGPVQYWSLHPLTPWAEIMRAQGLRDVEDSAELRQRVWAARLVLPQIANIGFSNATDHGLEPHHLVSDDYGACQELGERCIKDPAMPKVLTVPSAALPGTRNLVIFGPRVLIPYGMDPLGEEDAPASISAEQAEPPGGLAPLVRHFGAPHEGLVAWERNEAFDFVQPAVERLDDV